MVEDVIVTAKSNLDRLDPQSADDVRRAGEVIVRFSEGMRANEQALKTFLYANLYRHADVMRVRTGADQIVRELFDAYFANPRAMPEGWREGLDRADIASRPAAPPIFSPV